MNRPIKAMVGGSLQDDLDAFRSAWRRAERGEQTQAERVLAFESWEGLASVMTGEVIACCATCIPTRSRPSQLWLVT
jgi:predicted transcriptional regulator